MTFPDYYYVWLDSDELLSDNWKTEIDLHINNYSSLIIPYYQLMGSAQYQYPVNPIEQRASVFISPYPIWTPHTTSRYHCQPKFEGNSFFLKNVARIHLGYTTSNLVKRYITNIDRLDKSTDEVQNELFRQEIKANPFNNLTEIVDTSADLINNCSQLKKVIERHKTSRKVYISGKKILKIDYLNRNSKH